MVEVFVTPLETELEHEVQLGQRGVTSDKESTPDKWTDASQDNTQLIDVWIGLLLFHAQSVRRHTPCFKGSPRYLAVSRGALYSHRICAEQTRCLCADTVVFL